MTGEGQSGVAGRVASTASFTLWPMPELSPVPAVVLANAGGHASTQLPDESYERGVADGREQMKRELDSKLNDAVRALHTAVQALATRRQSCLAEMQEHIFVLALAVARHIIAREVSVQHEIIHDTTARALEHLSWETPIDIRLHPDDLELVRGRFESNNNDAPSAVAWVEDTAVGRGGCIVENDDRRVDSSIDTALKNVYEHLTDGAANV